MYVFYLILDCLRRWYRTHSCLFTIQVPNIRFSVAKELEDIAKVCGPSVFEQQISPILSLLLDDPDRDVRFYAEKTLATLEEEFVGKVEH